MMLPEATHHMFNDIKKVLDWIEPIVWYTCLFLTFLNLNMVARN
jgi:hypothetical protein